VSEIAVCAKAASGHAEVLAWIREHELEVLAATSAQNNNSPSSG
jgi:hypothetical protein